MADPATNPPSTTPPTPSSPPMSRSQLAQGIKQRIPALKDIPDDILVERALTSKPDLAKHVQRETPWQKFDRTRSQLPHGVVATYRNPKEFMQQTATDLGEVSQSEAEKAAGTVGGKPKFTGTGENRKVSFINPQTSTLNQAGHSLLSGLAGGGEVIAKLGAGLLDWRTAAGLLLSKLSPAASAAFFATQGASGAWEAIKNGQVTPENVQNFLLCLSAVAGAGGAGVEGGAGHPIEAVKSAGRGATDAVRLIGQESAGAGRGMVERAVRDRELKVQAQDEVHEATKGKVAKENAAAQAEHAEATKRVEEFNKEQAGAAGRRAELGTKLDADSANLSKGLKDLYRAAKAKASSLYAPIDAAVEGKTIPGGEARSLVEYAENEKLHGSEESIEQFRQIVNRTQVDPDLVGDADDPRGFSYSGITDATPLSIKDARGFVTELMDAVNNRPGLLGDVRSALTYVGKNLKSKVMGVYDEVGVGEQARAADAYYAQMKQTFDNMRSIKTREGSPVARAVRAPQDVPQYVRDPFINPDYGAKALKQIKAYESDPQLGPQAKAVAGLIEQIIKDELERKGLPKTAKVKEAPEAPTPKIVEKPHAPPPVDAFRMRLTRLEDFADRPYTFWDAVLPTRILEKVLLKFGPVKEWVASLPRSSDPDFIPKGERLPATEMGAKTKQAAKFVGELGDRGMTATRDYLRGSITREGYAQRLRSLLLADPADVETVIANVDRVKKAGEKKP